MATGKVKIIHNNKITGVVVDAQHGNERVFVDQSFPGKGIDAGDNVSYDVITVPITGEIAINLNLLQ